MLIHGITHSSLDKNVQIESQSVNSVLLDTNTSDYHERQEIISPYFSILIIYISICILLSDCLLLEEFV